MLHGSLPETLGHRPIEHGATQHIKFLFHVTRPIHICFSGTQIWTVWAWRTLGADFPFYSLLNTCMQPVLACVNLIIPYDSENDDDWCFVLFVMILFVNSETLKQRNAEDDRWQNITGQQHLKLNDQLPGWNQAWNVLDQLNHGCWQSLLDESRRCKHYPTQ